MKISWTTIGLVFAGGALGTLLRGSVSDLMEGMYSLAAVNIVGSAVLGWLNADPRFASERQRALWAVGFAGGFTTMSGVALFYVLGATFHPIALAWVAGIFALSLLAYWGAHALTERLTGNTAAVSQEIEERSE